ncbi:DUF302 domain-containing protein [Mycolicibacter arupensis]|uniref:DUF302 domain-containing protein n=1 Tax=Mycolicibacter arupensis TaxID=342002 RepID=A0A5C7Y8P8_9MYCO|nr:DUF302 domain-containing protein [Mycolicibacter arupensis]TXI57962.1 MAG: DUF302 domain-containing protein [Mycolicibacter arupensis]
MTAGLNTTVHAPFGDVVKRTIEALADHGFGVLTTIDVTATLKQKLGHDMEDYLILGACNPALAQRALDVDRHIGQLMPCNVVVRCDPADPAGGILVEAMDPTVMTQTTSQTGLQEIADEATTKLRAAIDTLIRASSS